MKIRYINMRGPYGIETVDEVREVEHKDSRAYRKEINNVLRGYREAGAQVYSSQRCTNDWKNV